MDALPQALYDELCRTRYPDNVIAPHEKGSNIRVDLPTARVPAPSVAWKSFIDYHTGPPFWRDVVRLFGDVIAERYPKIDLKSESVGIRGCGSWHIYTECQMGINTPCVTRSRVIGPHLDNPRELYAGLLYMPADDDPGEGDFQLLRYTKPPQFGKMRKVPDEYIELVATVKYAPNTFVMFINGPDAVHAVSERGPCTQYRRLLNIAGEYKKPLFEIPQC